MCGIVGYIGNQDALPIILAGLEKLEYRGYDSAGVALYEGGKVSITRAVGKLSELKKQFISRSEKQIASTGIGHTRWATHGRPTENNAHPHSAGRISLIHNGIVENYIELRAELTKSGSKFTSETDTEIIAHLLNKHLELGKKGLDAVRATCAELKGSYAFVAFDAKNPGELLIAKNFSPIVVGRKPGEVFVASDIPAILAHTRDVIILHDGDIASLKTDSLVVEHEGKVISREPQHITWDPITAQKGGYRHYMLKEIHEQAQVLSDTFRTRIDRASGHINLEELNFSAEQVKGYDRVVGVACGTAWHAALVGKFFFEKIARIPFDVDYASEFRYRTPVLSKKTLALAVTQSGETADTLSAIELAGKSCDTVAVCNVLGSSITRKVPRILFTHAGPEISVGSTKAFTTQLVALYLLAVDFGVKRGTISDKRAQELAEDLIALPSFVEQSMACESKVEEIAKKFSGASDFLFIGRGECYPVALEGALKLKELSYIHAEGYPAGEMKHGPIALIDEKMPVVVVLQKSDVLFDKTISNLREVESRGGRIIAITDVPHHPELHALAEDIIELPSAGEFLAPVILTIPLQMLAYYVAVHNGTDVDQPRNLAKSVTVE
jgi:glucosamine--fructose-6-phosphate aminotransferase (isomerizing)